MSSHSYATLPAGDAVMDSISGGFIFYAVVKCGNARGIRNKAGS